MLPSMAILGTEDNLSFTCSWFAVKSWTALKWLQQLNYLKVNFVRLGWSEHIWVLSVHFLTGSFPILACGITFLILALFTLNDIGYTRQLIQLTHKWSKTNATFFFFPFTANMECFHVISHVLSWQHLILQLNISHVASCTTISLFF